MTVSSGKLTINLTGRKQLRQDCTHTLGEDADRRYPSTVHERIRTCFLHSLCSTEASILLPTVCIVEHAYNETCE
jgi:hypothetical protein